MRLSYIIKQKKFNKLIENIIKKVILLFLILYEIIEFFQIEYR